MQVCFQSDQSLPNPLKKVHSRATSVVNIPCYKVITSFVHYGNVVSFLTAVVSNASLKHKLRDGSWRWQILTLLKKRHDRETTGFANTPLAVERVGHKVSRRWGIEYQVLSGCFLSFFWLVLSPLFICILELVN